MMHNNGLIALENNPVAPLDELQDKPYLFSRLDTGGSEVLESLTKVDDLVFVLGICAVPAEVSLSFYRSSGKACVDFEEYAPHGTRQRPMANRFTLCHPPKPLSDNLSRSVKRSLLKAHANLIEPWQTTTDEAMDTAVAKVRGHDLLRPEYRFTTIEGRECRLSQPRLVGGLALFNTEDGVVATAFFSNDRLKESAETLRKMCGAYKAYTAPRSQEAVQIQNEIQSGNLLSFARTIIIRAMAIEMPTKSQLEQLVELEPWLKQVPDIAVEQATVAA